VRAALAAMLAATLLVVRDPFPGASALGLAALGFACGPIFPSLAEGGPQVTYEAAGCRVPAIVTPAGAGHMTRDGQEGFVIASLDPDPWADAIRAAAANPEQRERMATRAEARAQLFTWAQVGARRIELLKARFGL